MKAIVYTEYGSADVLQLKEVEKPSPKDNEVLIKVHASTVTTADCNLRNFVFVPAGFGFLTRLVFGLTKPNKTILGVEFAGEIAAIGKAVTAFKVGESVFGIDGARLAAYAEYKTIPEDAGISRKPANWSYEEAVAVPNGALTALTFLRDMAKIQTGQTILIIGASGSIGTAAVQLAKYYGAEVTGLCSSANLELVKSLGADKLIDYSKEDFRTNGKRYDIIFDTVGKSSFNAAKNSLNPNGLYLAAAGGMREMGQMLLTSFFGKKKVLAGVASEKQADLLFIKELLEVGTLKPIIDRCYPLEQTAEAHAYVDKGHKKGNVVITVIDKGR